MSASDRWGGYKTPCPNCGGTVEYWYFGSDCRGNPGSSGIQCMECKRNFTYEEWCKVAAEELKPKLDEARKYELAKKRKETDRKRALSKLTPREKKAIGIH